MGHDSKEPQEDAAWTADRSGQSFRPGGLDDLPANAGDDATASTTQEHQPDSGGREHSRFLGDQLAEELSDNPVLFTQVTAYMQENHLHLPLLSPDHERMVRMRADTPELYEVYVQAIASQLHADEVARTLPYRASPGRVQGAGPRLDRSRGGAVLRGLPGIFEPPLESRACCRCRHCCPGLGVRREGTGPVVRIVRQPRQGRGNCAWALAGGCRHC